MTKKNQNIILLLAMPVCLFFVQGCSFNEVKNVLPNEDRLHLEKGYEFFCSGDYENAAEQFEIICQGSGTGHIRQEALYSLACTRMILAEDTEAFLQAADLWTVWNRQGALCPKFLPGENPRMFGPFLEKLSEGTAICCPETDDEPDMSGDMLPEFSEEPLEDKERPPEKQPPEIRSEKKIPASPSAVERKMRLDIRKKDREILSLKEQMRKMKKEMEKLKKQLNSLEEIHQEIQEKKKGMVSP